MMTNSALVVTGMATSGFVVGLAVNAAVHRSPRHERTTLASRRFVIELTTALLFAALTLRFGITAELPAYLYLVTVGVALTLIDFDVRRLPDSVILPSYVITVVLLLPAGAGSGDWHGAVRGLSGMAALLVLYFALALAYPNGLGFGDVKLAGLIGLYLGWLSWNALFVAAFGSLLIATAGGTAAVLTKRASRHS
ncbi:MAG TPA: A24 family peptidase, partial [Jatrophihabitans sp.]|nr:A24 family peptidase [Jatrophihabitans sp.]